MVVTSSTPTSNGSTVTKRSSASSNSTGNSGSGGDGHRSLSYTALFFMAMLALQFGIQPIVTKQFTSKNIIKSTVIFMQEVVKLIIGVVGISLGKTSWSDLAAGWTIMSWLRLSLLPATIYLIQNMCSLIAYQNLDAITYNVLNQTKTLSAALCCYFLMNKKQSLLQMLALLLLLTAALIMEKVVHLDMMLPSYWMNAHDGNNNATNNYSIMSNISPRHLSHGVIPIMIASFLSGLAGAITQKNGRLIRERGFFDEWTLSTIIPILTNSAGGILVGLVIKYAGTVQKGFALIFGILLSGIVQSVVDTNKILSREEVAGGLLAAVSLWMHSTYPYVEQKQHAEDRVHSSVAETGTNAVRGRKSRKED
ncbi:hypothetical protein ACHAWU_008644 [Discostella pseudostelligera]|uniref:Uncharacterized protein n=1 Tax=Discostella pseudostelligera TaxID=259834 RepID=A0ABD3M4R6_9STRA